MGTRIGVALMSALLLLYIVAISGLAITLIGSGDGVLIALGLALGVLPILGLWGLVAEVMFGFRSERLMVLMAQQGALPAETAPVPHRKRLNRQTAEAVFPTYLAAAEAPPQHWQAWMRLGIVYEASGDRRLARSSVRKAIELHRSSR